MREILFTAFVFVITWFLIFICAILYHNKVEVIKKVFRLNFKEISKVELWMSLIISFLIAAVISYSLI